ncbi:gp215.2 [Bacillus phage W.Ph.]|uniref:Gp215.2 n=1 Tax=Bacillus phage W.Ph. TaxID=764595 RepID=L7UXP4_9CAUD|nr:gp215.2 [Bacillus phage W.Ph.]AGC55711.1 gp215.2 [Bacillus phage W.Ph.]
MRDGLAEMILVYGTVCLLYGICCFAGWLIMKTKKPAIDDILVYGLAIFLLIAVVIYAATFIQAL